MKSNRSLVLVFILLIVSASLYRIIPGRPAGFAPQMAMALFGGAIIKDKKWAFVLPLLSLFISDLLYYFLHAAGLTAMVGFYDGQWAIYLVFALITLFGFALKNINIKNVALFSVSGSMIFFLLSNFITWATGTGFARPYTFNGLMLCYGDALAYYREGGLIHGFALNFILSDLIWCTALFGGYYLIRSYMLKPAVNTLQ